MGCDSHKIQGYVNRLIDMLTRIRLEYPTVGHLRALWNEDILLLDEMDPIYKVSYQQWNETSSNLSHGLIQAFKVESRKIVSSFNVDIIQAIFDMTNVVHSSRDAVQEFSTHEGHIVKVLHKLFLPQTQRFDYSTTIQGGEEAHRVAFVETQV